MAKQIYPLDISMQPDAGSHSRSRPEMLAEKRKPLSMVRPRPPYPVKLICGMIARNVELLDEAKDALIKKFGPVDIVSEVLDFDCTDYYADQMGKPLFRRFVAFEELIAPDKLADAKVATHAIEASFASRFGSAEVPRPINLDPGYVTLAKLVLASMKDFSHRIYLGREVYGEATLQFRQGKWRSHPWTFPDYASGRYDGFLHDVRSALMAAGEER